MLISDGKPTHASILLLGAAQVGKSTLSAMFRGLSIEIYDPTIEEQFYAIVISNSHRLVLNLIECGGHPSYQCLIPSAIRASDGFILVFDVGNRASLNAIWPLFQQIVEIQQKMPCKILILLVGTHANDKKFPLRRQVSRIEGQKIAKIMGIPYLETAMEYPETIQNCFQRLIKELNVTQADKVEGSRCSSVHSIMAIPKPLPEPIPGSLRARRDEAFQLWMKYQSRPEEFIESISLNSDTSIPSSSTIGLTSGSSFESTRHSRDAPLMMNGPIHFESSIKNVNLANSSRNLDSIMSKITDFQSSSEESSIQSSTDALDCMLASLSNTSL